VGGGRELGLALLLMATALLLTFVCVWVGEEGVRRLRCVAAHGCCTLRCVGTWVCGVLLLRCAGA